MIKFEINKAYKRLDSEQNIGEVVVSRNNDLIRTLMVFGFEDFETKHSNSWRISVIDDIEKIIAGDTVLLSADMLFCSETEKDEDPEANIEEVKEEDKEEEKEELQKDSDDWIVGREYEAICIETKQRYKLKLVRKDERECYPLMFESVISSFNYSDFFENLKDIAFTSGTPDETVIVFKHGIKSILDWVEAKEERKPVCFEVGKEYKDVNGEIWECKAIFDTNKDKVIVFYNKNKDLLIDQIIKMLNSVEYSTFRGTTYNLDFIADEQYRDEIQALL